MYPPDGQIEEKLSEASRARRERGTIQKQAEFLRGPIPLSWLAKAANLRGKALAVALAIWFAKGTRGSDVVKVSPTLVERFGVKRKPSYRALSALENAGLIVVDRQQGRCPRARVVLSPNLKSND